jgi:anaerobic selenocysteine-containing dehydrogenase
MAEPRVSPPRSWGRSTVQTACPLDCADSCSLSVTVERGEIVKIEGNTVAPSTHGYACPKVKRFDRRVYSPERLLHPLVRKGAKGRADFERVSWDEALDLVVDRLTSARETFGAESVLPFYRGGSNGLLTCHYEDARFFRRFGASRLGDRAGSRGRDAAARLYGAMGGVAYEDYEAARLIVVWGSNPSSTSVHLLAHITRAQEAGARVVVVDPRRTPVARTADLHLPVRPGTDAPVALAVIRSLFESGRADRAFLDAHCDGDEALRAEAEPWTIARAADEAGIDADDLATFAEWYAATTPAVIRCGRAPVRGRNGDAASRAILALPAVAGKFGVRGGGYTTTNAPAWGVDAEALIGVPAPETRTIDPLALGRALTDSPDPPVAVLFVYDGNPLTTAPDQNRVRRGLMRDDLFTVVHDQVMTDTALYADVLLPATTFLEHYDIARGEGAYHLHLVQPVIAPVGEARSNQDLFRELGVRFGQAEDDTLGEAGALMDAASRLSPDLAAPLLAGEVPVPPGGRRPIQFVDVRPSTANGRVQLAPTSGAAESSAYGSDAFDGAYPLTLIAPSSEHTISSTLGELRPNLAHVRIHPDDAHARSIAEGESVRVFNALGEVQCEATVTPEIRPGTVSLPSGLWARSTYNGSTATALTSDAPSDVNGARVQVELWGRH